MIPSRGPGIAVAVCLAVLTAACWAVNAVAQDGPTITHIEEDWVIELGVPDPDNDAPQIIVVGAPSGSLAYSHAVFEINHRTQPDYEAGGLQLQRWRGEDMLQYCNSPNRSVLSHDSETVRFTMSMSVTGGNLVFEVLNGTSSSWGNFGGQGYLRSSASTGLHDLMGYNSEVSLQHSRVGYASHRVKKLARTAVRYYAGNTLIATDSTERVVHQYTEGY